MELHAFCHLKGEGISCQAASGNGLQELLSNVLIPQLGIGNVYANVELRNHLTPNNTLKKGLLQNPKSHSTNQAGLLQNRNEFHGRHHATSRRMKAKQCLCTKESKVLRIDLGLIVNRKTFKAILNGIHQLFLQLQCFQLLLVISSGKELQHVLTLGLTELQGIFCILAQAVAVGDMVLTVGHTSTGNGTMALKPLLDFPKNLFYF